jgi:demethylmenaquinone methyltransferase/2-methoxy-6-polyprenyl-1,4-benzoquinol methylase
VKEKSSNHRSWDTDKLPQGAAKATAVREMFDSIAPRYDLVNRIMTFRLDVRWRRRTVRSLLIPKGNCVLDLASGTGDLCVELRNNGFKPISVDVSLGMLQADHSGSPRVQADILRLPFPDKSVDGITCGFALRNLIDLPTFFDEIARVTRVGGRIALLDVGVPRNRLIRFGNSVYFGKIVPRIGGLLSNRAAYNYLPRSIAYLPSAEKLCSMITDAGFAEVEHHQLSGGLTQLLLGTRAR